MSKATLSPAKLTPAAQSAILSQFPWLPNGKVRVTSTHRTEALLRKAGVSEPKPLEFYDLSVRRDEAGFLTLNPYSSQKILESSDDTLFETGGICAGEPATEPMISTVQRIPESARAEYSALCEIPCTRIFEIMTSSHSKIRVQIVAFEDEALPSPNEREQWKPAKPTDTQAHAAIAALHLSRRLTDFEHV